jgi:hypothetical protein
LPGLDRSTSSSQFPAWRVRRSSLKPKQTHRSDSHAKSIQPRLSERHKKYRFSPEGDILPLISTRRWSVSDLRRSPLQEAFPQSSYFRVDGQKKWRGGGPKPNVANRAVQSSTAAASYLPWPSRRLRCLMPCVLSQYCKAGKKCGLAHDVLAVSRRTTARFILRSQCRRSTPSGHSPSAHAGEPASPSLDLNLALATRVGVSRGRRCVWHVRISLARRMLARRAVGTVMRYSCASSRLDRRRQTSHGRPIVDCFQEWTGPTRMGPLAARRDGPVVPRKTVKGPMPQKRQTVNVECRSRMLGNADHSVS